MERTLCLHGNGVPIEQEVTVVVSTSSIEDIFFDIRLFEVEDFALGVNDVGKVDWKATRNFRLLLPSLVIIYYLPSSTGWQSMSLPRCC